MPTGSPPPRRSRAAAMAAPVAAAVVLLAAVDAGFIAGANTSAVTGVTARALAGGDPNAQESPVPEPTTTPDATGWVRLPGGWADYAPSGVPDIDQRQGAWRTVPPLREAWTHDGPVAALNALWWLDSRLEPNPAPPDEPRDGFDLLTALGPWDDHDPENVPPAVGDLAIRSSTNGPRRMFTVGTCLTELTAGVNSLLSKSTEQRRFAARMLRHPSTQDLRDAIGAGRPTVLLLGLWQHHHLVGWQRIGGHYVTLEAINATTGRLRVSDPFRDMGVPSGASSQHNDASVVSHDGWILSPSLRPEEPLRLDGYLDGPDQEQLVANFAALNPERCDDRDTAWLDGAILEADIDAAMVIEPAVPPTATLTRPPTQSPTAPPATTAAITTTLTVTTTTTAATTATLTVAASATGTTSLTATPSATPGPPPTATVVSTTTARPSPSPTATPQDTSTAVAASTTTATAPPLPSPAASAAPPASGDVCGRVTRRGGGVAAGIQMTLLRNDVEERHTTTGADGTYCFLDVPSALYWVRASHGTCRPAAAPANVAGAPVRVDLTLTCQPGPVHLPFLWVQRPRTSSR